MEIFCQKCQKRVGQVADEKIPVGQKASVTCPVCGEKIILRREAPAAGPGIAAGAAPPPPPPPPGIAIPRRHEHVGTVSPEAIPDYDFEIMAILKEAWRRTSGVKGPIWGAAFMIFLVVIAMGIASWMLSTMLGGEGENAALGAALQITLTVAMYPFLAGVMMIGIRHAVDRPVNWKMAFGYFSFLLPIVVSAVLVTVLTFIGFLLLFLPGLYLSLAYMLVIPLIIDKGLGPWQAMEVSRKAIHKHWFKVFGLYFLMALIYVVSMVPLFLGVIWTMPMLVMVGAILYREIFGVSEST